jgi:hypothetical protein
MYDIKEGSPKYLQFAMTACEEEGRRLQELLQASNSNNQAELDETGTESGNSPVRKSAYEREDEGMLGTDSVDEVQAGDNSLDGRHLHRLEGKCGHKAVLHQPADGDAHIDFIVGDKVECYMGSQSINSGTNGNIWPSQYKCKDVNCSTGCAKNAGSKQNLSDDFHGKDAQPFVLLDLQDLNFDGKEWNFDVMNDDGILGLFKLGDNNSSEKGDNGDV